MAEFKNWCIRFDTTNAETAKKNLGMVTSLLFGNAPCRSEIGACFIQGAIYGGSEHPDGSIITTPDIKQISIDYTGNVISVVAEDGEYFMHRSTAHEEWYSTLRERYQRNLYEIAGRTNYKTPEEAYISEMHALLN